MATPTENPRCILVLFAHGAEASPRYTLSIERIFVGIETESVPHSFPSPFFTVTFWEGPRGLQRTFDLRHRSPSGASGRLTGTIDIGPKGKGHSLISVQRMTFDAYGDHWFDVIVDGNVVLSESLAVLPGI